MGRGGVAPACVSTRLLCERPSHRQRTPTCRTSAARRGTSKHLSDIYSSSRFSCFVFLLFLLFLSFLRLFLLVRPSGRRALNPRGVRLPQSWQRLPHGHDTGSRGLADALGPALPGDRPNTGFLRIDTPPHDRRTSRADHQRPVMLPSGGRHTNRHTDKK